MLKTQDGAADKSRRLLKSSYRAIGAALLLGLGLALSACGGSSGTSGSKATGNTAAAEAPTAVAHGKPSGELTMSAWPLYIDPKTIPDFEKATGIKVKYIEDYNDNEEFYGKIQPLLAKGESGGRSLLVAPSPYIVERMIRQGYIQKFDKSDIPAVMKNLAPEYRNPAYDPGNQFSVPWQSGLMGMAVRTDLAPGIKSACDLFNPKYKGKVEIFTEMRQSLGVIMKCMGVKTDTPSEAQWMAAINKVKQAKEDGQIRKFAGNNWTREILDGDAWASTGAAGDTHQLEVENPKVKWVMPEQGCVIFTNDIVVPVGSPNPGAAYAFMNYVYTPEHAAQIDQFTTYLSPVQGTKQAMEKLDPELAENPLVFPTKGSISKCSPEPTLSASIEQKVNAAWQAVVSG